jgi:hypothetical protein
MVAELANVSRRNRPRAATVAEFPAAHAMKLWCVRKTSAQPPPDEF